MEVAYRYIIDKLNKLDLVKDIKYTYWLIQIRWKSGIKERWIFNRKYGRIAFRTRYRPRMLPKSKWPEEISNGMVIKPSYLYDVNPVEHDLKKYGICARFSWEDFKKLGAYEQLVFPHQFIDFVKKNYDFEDIKYPDPVLIKSVQAVLDEPSKFFRSTVGYKTSKPYMVKDRPGQRFLENFIQIQYLGKNQLSRSLLIHNMPRTRELYNAIYRMIRRNKKKEELGRTPVYDFDLRSLVHIMVRNRKYYISRAKFRCTGLYKALFEDFKMVGKNILDLEPRYGEKCLVSLLMGINYNYVETSPFDMSANDIASYLGKKVSAFNKDIIYDLAYVDFNFCYDLKLADYYLTIYANNFRELIMFVSNMDHDNTVKLIESKNRFKIINTNKPVKVSKNEYTNGHFFYIINQI